MSPIWFSLITSLTDLAKKNQTPVIACTECGEQERYAKHGTYSRYSIDEQETIKIKRLKCNNDLCPRVTFSILPYPFLRISRASLCMFLQVLLLIEQGESIQAISNFTGKSWPVIQRWVKRGSEIQEWLKKTASHSPWQGEICRLGSANWHEFIRQFSWHFYPNR